LATLMAFAVHVAACATSWAMLSDRVRSTGAARRPARLPTSPLSADSGCSPGSPDELTRPGARNTMPRSAKVLIHT
jgi:hypothetical protein